MDPRRSSGFSIRTGCPGCGGMLQLESDFRTTHCEHCQSVVRIRASQSPHAYLLKPKIAPLQVRFHIDRYLKENALPLSTPALETDGVYVPYWQVEGMLLRLRHKVETHFDVSEWDRGDQVVERREETTEINLSPYAATIAASGRPACYPASLGIRTQVAVLHPLTDAARGDDFELAALQVGPADAVAHARRTSENLDRVAQVGNKKNQSRLFVTRLSVIYMPYYRCRSGAESGMIVDAISGEVTTAELEPEEPAQADSAVFGTLEVELHQCQNCGTALTENVSYLQVCPECAKVVGLDSGLAIEIMPLTWQNQVDANNILFPFYVFEIVPDDTGRLNQALRGLSAAKRLIVPAFAMGNFEAMYRLAARMSTAAAQTEVAELAAWPQKFSPVTVSVAEAQALATAVYARAASGRDDAIAGKSFVLAASSIRLMFAAFRPDGYFFVDGNLGAVTFERAALKS